MKTDQAAIGGRAADGDLYFADPKDGLLVVIGETGQRLRVVDRALQDVDRNSDRCAWTKIRLTPWGPRGFRPRICLIVAQASSEDYVCAVPGTKQNPWKPDWPLPRYRLQYPPGNDPPKGEFQFWSLQTVSRVIPTDLLNRWAPAADFQRIDLKTPRPPTIGDGHHIIAALLGLEAPDWIPPSKLKGLRDSARVKRGTLLRPYKGKPFAEIVVSDDFLNGISPNLAIVCTILPYTEADDVIEDGFQPLFGVRSIESPSSLDVIALRSRAFLRHSIPGPNIRKATPDVWERIEAGLKHWHGRTHER